MKPEDLKPLKLHVRLKDGPMKLSYFTDNQMADALENAMHISYQLGHDHANNDVRLSNEYFITWERWQDKIKELRGLK